MMPRTSFNRIALTDRKRVIEEANKCGDWKHLAQQLGINEKTAYTWIRNETPLPKRKGGSRKKLSEDNIDRLCEEMEKDPALTLEQLVEKVRNLFGVQVSKSSLSEYLKGKLVTLKKAHAEPESMNTPGSKIRRRE